MKDKYVQFESDVYSEVFWTLARSKNAENNMRYRLMVLDLDTNNPVEITFSHDLNALRLRAEKHKIN
jgi:hypothetical protein